MVAKENWKREQANVLLYIQIDYNKPFVLGEIQNAAVFWPITDAHMMNSSKHINWKLNRLWFCLKGFGDILTIGILKIRSECRKWRDASINSQELKIHNNDKVLLKFEY